MNEKTVESDYDLNTATYLNNLAGVSQSPQIAREYYERALQIEESKVGRANPRIVDGLNNLASVLGRLGDLAQAETCLRRALEILEKNGRTDNLRTAGVLDNLAVALMNQRKGATAEPLLRRAVTIHQKLGPETLEAAKTLNDLGILSDEKSDIETAIASFERALAIYEKHSGPAVRDAQAVRYRLEEARKRK
jgi:tetratricopeptide (TPR) repeat protein